MTDLLATLGLTKEELQERVVARICSAMLSKAGFDEDGIEYSEDNEFGKTVKSLVKQRVDDTVAAIAERTVLPQVSAMVESLSLQETNRWGEKVGSPKTFVEYLTARAESYLQEEVNYEGKSKNEAGGGYWAASETRVSHLVHKHLSRSIATAMKDAVNTIQASVTEGLAATVKIKLTEIAEKLSIVVKTT